MEYVDINQAIRADGLRIVMVRNFPSPWSQAAKAMMEYKGLDFIATPLDYNPTLLEWAGATTGGPVVAWNDEPLINRWNDILLLLERVAPAKPLVPEEPAERVQLFGLSHEICGELGFGWNRRLDMVRPAMASGKANPNTVTFAQKYGYNDSDVALANARVIAFLRHLTTLLKAQRDRGSNFLIGDGVTAADFYWAAFSNLAVIQSLEECPLEPAVRAGFINTPAEIIEACDPILIEHRDRIMRTYFELPMAL